MIQAPGAWLTFRGMTLTSAEEKRHREGSHACRFPGLGQTQNAIFSALGHRLGCIPCLGHSIPMPNGFCYFGNGSGSQFSLHPLSVRRHRTRSPCDTRPAPRQVLPGEARVVTPGARRGESDCDERGHADHSHPALIAAGVGGSHRRPNDGDLHGMGQLVTATDQRRPCHAASATWTWPELRSMRP